MPNTPRMRWPFPAENTKPHYDALVSLYAQQDASGYASREDRHIIIQGGGDLEYEATTGVLSWASNIELLAAITGFNWVLPAGQVTLDDGELFYVDLVRAPTLNRTIAATVASQVPSTDIALLIGARRGDKVYFRNGSAISDGEILGDISSGGGGGVDNFSYKTVIAASQITIPVNQQMIVSGGFEVDGTVNLFGEIILL